MQGSWWHDEEGTIFAQKGKQKNKEEKSGHSNNMETGFWEIDTSWRSADVVGIMKRHNDGLLICMAFFCIVIHVL